MYTVRAVGQTEIATTCGSAGRCCRMIAEEEIKGEETQYWRGGEWREVEEEYIITWQS